MPGDVKSELAPTGVLRAAINMGNFLLVTGKSTSGDPEGVAPDMAREIATRLGAPVKYLPYARPGELADDAEKGLWDIGLIGAEPQRAAVLNFTAAYCEIEATYGLWLENNVKKAQLLQFDSADAALKQFDSEKMDAYAGLRPGLLAVAQARPGSRILDGQFTAVQQAVGTPRKNTAAAAFLRDFVEEAKKSGLVARLIERHGVVGRLSVAPPG